MQKDYKKTSLKREQKEGKSKKIFFMLKNESKSLFIPKE